MKPDMESQKRNLSTRKDQLIKIAGIRPLNNDEITELNSIKYLLEDEETLNQRATEALEVTKKTIRDTQTVQIIKHNLAEPFIEFGGGAKWNNKDIINNITWYGRARSDETAKIAGEITTQILITVAVSLATAGAGAAITAGLIARVGALWARLASSAIWAKRIKTFVSISQRWWKGFRTASKVEKAITIWTQASGLLLEGTIFNATSTALSNMINGREFLNGVNLNPLAKENIKTAAFLWALGIAKSFSIIWSRTTLPWKSGTKIWIDFSKLGKIPWVKFTAEIAKELSAMFAAEQVINFTFGHDIIDPETGEVTTGRGLHMPNEQEWATMIGMILALKVANPTLWGKIHQNLNNGTIKICKSITWKTVLYNPKNNKIVDLNNLAKDWNKLVDNTTNGVKTKNKPTSDMGWKTIDIKNLSPEILDAIKHTEKQIALNNRRIAELQQSKRQNPLSWKEKIELMQLYEANRDLKNDIQELKKGNMKLSEDSSSKLLEKYADIEKKMIDLKEKADKRSNKLPEIQSEKTKKAASDWLNKFKIKYFELALEQDILIEQWIDWVNQFEILKDIIDMNQIAKRLAGDFNVKNFIENNKGLTLEKLKELRNVLNGNKLDLYDLHQYSTIFEKHPDLDIAFTRKLIEKIEGKPLMDKYEKYIDFLDRYPNINHKMIKEIFEFTKEEPTFDKVEKYGELLKNHPEMDSNMLLEEFKEYKREEQPKSSEDKTRENMEEKSDNFKDSKDLRTSEKEVQENHKQVEDMLKWSSEELKWKIKRLHEVISDNNLVKFLSERTETKKEAWFDKRQIPTKKWIHTDNEKTKEASQLTWRELDKAEFSRQLKAERNRRDEDIEKVIQIKDDLDTLGIEVNRREIGYLAELDPKDIKKVVEMKGNLDTLGVKINYRDIFRLAKLNPKNIEKIVQMKNTLDLLGIKVNTQNIRELTELNPKDIEKVAQMKSNLDLLEIKVDAWDIRELAESNPKDIEKLIQIKSDLDILGVKIYSWDIRRLAESNPKDIEKVIQMKENLDILGIKVYSWNIRELANSNPKDIERAIQMKDDLDILRLGFSSRSIKELTKLDPKNVEKLIQKRNNWDLRGVEINGGNIRRLTEAASKDT